MGFNYQTVNAGLPFPLSPPSQVRSLISDNVDC